MHVSAGGGSESSQSLQASGTEHLGFKDGALKATMVHQVVKEVYSLHLLVVVNVGLVEPCEVLAFKL